MTNRKSAIQSIDVRGLPEPVVATLHSIVQMYRRDTPEVRPDSSQGLLQKAGRLKGEIGRANIYDDAR